MSARQDLCRGKASVPYFTHFSAAPKIREIISGRNRHHGNGEVCVICCKEDFIRNAGGCGDSAYFAQL
ncbi:hypothetical protein MLD38_001765 [Melastoma candidum]|uniref:Uncharacterized protein n=1 Tax=Melastoma candidum TaxID=119954 RepID=A0ACB9SDR2_9MYRT|nr:hypothetical protein MLD38_001765 [Melastoma candidum]